MVRPSRQAAAARSPRRLPGVWLWKGSTAAGSVPSAYSGRCSPIRLCREERGFALALEADVEPQNLTVNASDQCVAAAWLELGEDRVDCVGLLLVRKVDEGVQVAKQPAGEDSHVQVGRSHPSIRVMGGRRLLDCEVKRALGIGTAARELLSVPQLDKALSDRLTRAIEDVPFDPNRSMIVRMIDLEKSGIVA